MKWTNKKRLLYLLLVFVILLLLGVAIRRMFPLRQYMPMEDRILEQLMEALETQNAEKIKSLFSENTVSTVIGLDEQIQKLCDFYSGEMKGYEDKGSSEYLSRQPGFRTKTVRASYDITTSSDIYRIALQFCSIDTTDQGNLGCNSLYITKLGNSDMAYSYWGNWEWEPGIVIEYDSE